MPTKEAIDWALATIDNNSRLWSHAMGGTPLSILKEAYRELASRPVPDLLAPVPSSDTQSVTNPLPEPTKYAEDAVIIRTVGDTMWLCVPIGACKYEEFIKFPNHIEVNGHIFEKRSFHYDGINYCGGEGEDLAYRPALQSFIFDSDHNKQFRKVPAALTCLRGMEEMVELLEELTDGAGIHLDGMWLEINDAIAALQNPLLPVTYKQRINRDAAKSEIGDVAHCLLDLCGKIMVSFDEAAREKLEVNNQRTFGERPDGLIGATKTAALMRDEHEHPDHLG